MNRPGKGGNPVNKQDLQNLLMYQEAVRMVRADPSLEARALEILERWDTVAPIRSKPLRDEWKRIIAERDWKLALEESDRGQQLRQASPMTFLLPEQVRLDINQSPSTSRMQCWHKSRLTVLRSPKTESKPQS